MMQFSWGYVRGEDNSSRFVDMVDMALSDMRVYLLPAGKIDPNTYTAWRNTMGMLSIEYDKNPQQFPLDLWREVWGVYISVCIKSGDLLNAKNYLMYFDDNDWQNYKIRVLEQMRLLSDPQKELIENSRGIFENILKMSEIFPEKFEKIIGFWTEYLDRVFSLTSFSDIQSRVDFLKKFENYAWWIEFFKKIFSHQGFCSFLIWNIGEEWVSGFWYEGIFQEILTIIPHEGDNIDTDEKVVESKEVIFENNENNTRETIVYEELNLRIAHLEEENAQLREYIKQLEKERSDLEQEKWKVSAELARVEMGVIEQMKVTTGAYNSLHRSEYRIGLVFGSAKSAKNFKRDNTNKNEIYIDLGLSKENFEVINEDFDEQRKISVRSLQNRFDEFANNPLHFILVFEFDHETEFNHMVNSEEYRHRFVVSQKDGQHYSKAEFAKMLLEGIERFERENNNTRA